MTPEQENLLLAVARALRGRMRDDIRRLGPGIVCEDLVVLESALDPFNRTVAEDPIDRFIRAALRRQPGKAVEYREVYAAYRTWCIECAEPPLSSTMFARCLEARGYRRDREVYREHVYLNLGLCAFHGRPESAPGASTGSARTGEE